MSNQRAPSQASQGHASQGHASQGHASQGHASQGHASQGHVKITSHDDFYDPAKSTTSAENLQVWLRSPLTDDLCQVPGIGTQYKSNLHQVPEGFEKGSEEAITTPHQLIGKYLMMKAEGVGCVEMTNKFYLWLKARGIKSGGNSICEAIAEKTNVFCPGLYNKDLFQQLA